MEGAKRQEVRVREEEDDEEEEEEMREEGRGEDAKDGGIIK